jgi:hypothetical protein
MEDPTTLACGHSACVRCIRAHLASEARKALTPLCPLCRAPIKAKSEELAVSVMMARMIEKAVPPSERRISAAAVRAPWSDGRAAGVRAGSAAQGG